jgi:hypothetical protein
LDTVRSDRYVSLYPLEVLLIILAVWTSCALPILFFRPAHSGTQQMADQDTPVDSPPAPGLAPSAEDGTADDGSSSIPADTPLAPGLAPSAEDGTADAGSSSKTGTSELLGPADWTVSFLDPRHISPGYSIRQLKSDGIDILVESIRIKGYQLPSLVVVWRDPEQQHGAVPPKNLCVDGMHRVRATCKLILDGHERWLASMRDPTGQVVMQYAVLHKRNATTGSIVKTTYVDVLTSIQTARDVVSGNSDPKFPVNRVYRKRVLKIVYFVSSTNLSKRTLRDDVGTQITLTRDVDLMQPILDIAASHGHDWFSRRGLNALLLKKDPNFILVHFKAWLEKQNPPNQSDNVSSRIALKPIPGFFIDFCDAVEKYSVNFFKACKK